MEDEKEYNKQRPLRAASWHFPFSGDSASIPDARASLCEVRDDEPEGTGGDIEVSKDSYDGVVAQTVKSFAEINSYTKDSRGILGLVKVLEDEVSHSDNIVNYRAPRKST